MKYPKIAETLDKIVYLIGKQGISYRWVLETVGPCEILDISCRKHIAILYSKSTFIHHFGKMSST